jgi:hypothetical protein
MASVNVAERMNELTDGTVCSADATTRAEIGPYRESRIRLVSYWKRGLTLR